MSNCPSIPNKLKWQHREALREAERILRLPYYQWWWDMQALPTADALNDIWTDLQRHE